MKKVFAMILGLILFAMPLFAISAVAEEDPGYVLDTSTKTYTVTTADGYLAVCALVNDGKLDYNITLGADIDLAGKELVQIGTSTDAPYLGVFDGGGFAIRNLTFHDENANGIGLVKYCGATTFKNVTFVNPDISAASHVSCLVAHPSGNILITNCHIVGGTMSIGIKWVGGFVARFEKPATESTIEYCSVDGLTISGPQTLGFIAAGEAAETDFVLNVHHCIAKGLALDTDKTSTTRAAQIAYTCDATVNISDCFTIGDFSNCNMYFGAMNGQTKRNNLSYTNCIGNTSLCGALEQHDGKTTTGNNCAVFSPFATTDGEKQHPLYNVTPVDGTDKITIDGESAKFSTAALPVITTDTTKSRIETMFASNEALKTLALKFIEEEANHVHEYNQQVVSDTYLKSQANCQSKAIYYYSCICGKRGEETFEYGEMKDHVFSEGYLMDDTSHWLVCIDCQTEKKDEGEHTFGEWVVTREATEKRAGKKVRTCTVCGYEEIEAIDKLTPVTETEAPDTSDTISEAAGCRSIVTGNLMLVFAFALIPAGFSVRKKKHR